MHVHVHVHVHVGVPERTFGWLVSLVVLIEEDDPSKCVHIQLSVPIFKASPLQCTICIILCSSAFKSLRDSQVPSKHSPPSCLNDDHNYYDSSGLDTSYYCSWFFLADSTASQKSISREQSVEVIHLDVLRTFPTLGFFQTVSVDKNSCVVSCQESGMIYCSMLSTLYAYMYIQVCVLSCNCYC